MIYDYVIIGGGLAGLLTGALLAKEQNSVVVLDKNKKVGGYLQDLVPGVPFGAHHIGIPDKKLLEEIGDKLHLSFEGHMRQADQVTVVLNHKEYTISLSLSEQEKQLIAMFPKEELGIHTYIKYMTDFSKVLYAGDNKAIRKYFVELAMISFEKFLKRFFEDELLIQLLTFLGPSYGGVEKEDSAFTFASLIVTYGKGAYYFDTDWLIHRLEQRINESQTGQMRYGFQVAKMRFVNNTSCYEVLDKKGEKVRGRKVVFASYFVDMLSEYCKEAGIESKILDKIFSMEVGPSAYRYYFKMKEGTSRHEWIHLGETPAIISTLEQDSCNVMVTFVSSKEQRVDDLAQVALQLVEETFHISQDDIAYKLVSTPVHKKQMTGNKDGSVFGWTRSHANNMTANLIYNLHQQVKDIYVVGNWSATFGVFGVLYTVDKFMRQQDMSVNSEERAS